jgi:catechol 2,3-dioxygenase
MTDTALHPDTCVGHVHLWVSDLDRAIAFYRDVIGLQVTEDMRDASPPRGMVFLAAGDYHHHVGLRERKTPVSQASTGLFHFALRYPNRLELARALKRILDHGYPIDSVVDYGPGEAVNVSDPDGNGVELGYDRPAESWPRVDGQLHVFVKKLDRKDLLAELEREPAATAL